MSKQRVIIEISPSRVEIALLKGGVAERNALVRLDRADWPGGAGQAEALDDATAQLVKLSTDLGAVGAQATVIYSIPGSVASLTSCAAGVSTAAAEQAATLALTSIADFPLDDAPIDTCPLLTDKADPTNKDAVPQRHTLVIADAEHRVAALVALVEAAGIEVVSLLPADSVAMAKVVRDAASEGDGGVAAVLFVGEHSSMLGVGTPGRLLFVRPVAGGTEALADALTRPLRPRDPDSPPVNLPHAQARTLVLASGVPAPDATIPGHPTLAGSSLLPHVQPLLQRLSVELKQSVRFGVPEADRASVRIRVVGPGAAVPGLEAAISRLSGFPRAAVLASPEPDALESSAGGLIAALVAAPGLTAALMSESVRLAARHRTLRKALIAGVLVAAAFVGLQFMDARSSLVQARAALAQIREAGQAGEGPAAVRVATVEARQSLASAETRLTNLLGSAPDMAATLAELSLRTPSGVRITGMELVREASQSRVELRAYVRADTNADPAAAIRSYVDALSKSPVIESVRLGGTQRTNMHGSDAQSFELTLVLVSLPPSDLLPQGSAHGNAPAPATAVVGAPADAQGAQK